MPQLKKITQEELDEKVREHFFFLKGDPTKKADLSFIDFEGLDLSSVNLKGANFEGSDLRNVQVYGVEEDYPNHYVKVDYSDGDAIYGGIRNANFENANFRNANLFGLSFEGVNIDGAIFIGALFDPGNLSEAQKQDAIFTEEELIERLKKQNEIIEKQGNTIEKQEVALEQVSENHTEELKKGFQKSHDVFKNEELIWLKTTIFIFIILLLSSFFPVFFSLGLKNSSHIALFFIIVILLMIITIIDAVISRNEQKQENGKIATFFKRGSRAMLFIGLAYLSYQIPNMIQLEGGNFSYEKLLSFLPLDIIVAIFLYFCVAQYSKAKTLRIEFQNKLAIIDGYMALTAQLATAPERRIDMFLPNISNVLFTKAVDKGHKESNLPVDEILRIIELAKK